MGFGQRLAARPHDADQRLMAHGSRASAGTKVATTFREPINVKSQSMQTRKTSSILGKKNGKMWSLFFCSDDHSEKNKTPRRKGEKHKNLRHDLFRGGVIMYWRVSPFLSCETRIRPAQKHEYCPAQKCRRHVRVVTAISCPNDFRIDGCHKKKERILFGRNRMASPPACVDRRPPPNPPKRKNGLQKKRFIEARFFPPKKARIGDPPNLFRRNTNNRWSE